MEQAAVLKHEAQGGSIGAQAVLAEVHGRAVNAQGARRGRQQAADDAQQRGLPSARRPDHRQRRHIGIEVNTPQHLHAVEGLAHIPKLNAHGRHTP